MKVKVIFFKIKESIGLYGFIEAKLNISSGGVMPVSAVFANDEVFFNLSYILAIKKNIL